MSAYLLTNKRLRANLLIASLLLALPGCTAAPWERDFWHPPAAKGADPIKGQAYPIQRASGEDMGDKWPNLADVPAKLDNPLPEADANAQLSQLAAERDGAAGQAAAGAARSSSDLTVPSQAPSTPPEL